MTALEPGVIAHGLRALADHIETHHLPAPHGVDVRPAHLSVRIPSNGAEAWAVTLAGGDGIRCLTAGSDVGYWETRGLLPDTGVRVRLTWSRATSWAVPA